MKNKLYLSFLIRFYEHQLTSCIGKVSKCGVISGPYFPIFGLYTGKYGTEITPNLDTFHAMLRIKLREGVVHKKSFFSADLLTFTEKILNGKLHFMYSGVVDNWYGKDMEINRKLIHF